MIKADTDERQAFADRLGLSIPVAKEEESDVVLAKRTTFHSAGQSPTVALCGCSMLQCCPSPSSPHPPKCETERAAGTAHLAVCSRCGQATALPACTAILIRGRCVQV